jgi:hypothetical protein
METGMTKATETGMVIPDEMFTGPIGGESLSSIDMTIPYVELVQSLSGCATRQEGKKIEIGHWHNSLTDEDYGKEMSVVVLDAIAGYQLKEEAKEGEKSVKIIATRWKSEKVRGYNAEMITDDMINSRTFKPGNLLGDAYCYQAIINGKDLVLITLKSSACKAARGLNTMLMNRTIVKDGKTYHVPFFCNQFKFSAKWIDKIGKDGKPKKYYEPVITPDGDTRPQLLRALFDMAKDLSKKTVSTVEPVEDLEDKQAF